MEGIAGRADLRLTHLSVVTRMVDEADVAKACAVLLESQPSLASIEIYPWKAAGRFGQHLTGMRLLRNLGGQLVFNEESEIKSFFQNLAQGCPRLEIVDVNIESLVEDGPEEVLQFRTLQPLLQAKQMKLISVYSCFNAILIGNDDVTAMGKAWPKMESLRIPSSAPVSILSTFAHAFPSSLKYLSPHLGHSPQPSPHSKRWTWTDRYLSIWYQTSPLSSAGFAHLRLRSPHLGAATGKRGVGSSRS